MLTAGRVGGRRAAVQAGAGGRAGPEVRGVPARAEKGLVSHRDGVEPAGRGLPPWPGPTCVGCGRPVLVKGACDSCCPPDVRLRRRAALEEKWVAHPLSPEALLSSEEAPE